MLTQADFARSHNSANSHPGSPLSPGARKKLLLGLEIAFGVVRGMVLVGVGLAALRRCTAVRDTALVDEDAEKGWTADEKTW